MKNIVKKSGKDSAALRFLYRTAPGRLVLKLLACPGFSRLAGNVLDSRFSGWFVPYYIRKNEIDMSGMEIPAGGFPSFNAFFTRRRTAEEPCRQSGALSSPCDGFLSFIRIRKNRIFDIKHTTFTLEELLSDKELAAEFEDGLALVFRLTPANYHRYSYAAPGRILCHRKIGGVLHCVRPIATRTVPVYAQNSREYEVIWSEEFGKIVQMEIGALMVGKITNPGRKTADSDRVRAGEEKGYFEFGGSTILLLLQKGSARISRKLYEARNETGEVPVRKGDRVAIPAKNVTVHSPAGRERNTLRDAQKCC